MLGNIRHFGKLATDPQYREFHRLLSLPRKQPGSTSLLGRQLKFVDGRSCALQHLVIFQNNLYATSPLDEGAKIIDAGANIGMASIFFKRSFPTSRIIAFEADPAIAQVMRDNISSFGLNGIEIHQAAVSDKNGQTFFEANGSDGGKITATNEGTPIQTIRLRDWLHEPVDLLKVDIEGEEIPVIFDCKEELRNVSRIFVEYHSFTGRKQMLPEFLAILRDAGFRLLIQTDHCPPSPFLDSTPDGDMDMRLNIFGIRDALEMRARSGHPSKS